MQDKTDTITKILCSIHCAANMDEAISAVLRKLLFCPFCAIFFTDSSDFENHIKKDHSDRLASKAIKVEAHEVDEDAETIYICPHCRFAVDNNCPSPTSSIMSHIEKHTISIDPTARISFQISKDKELIQSYCNNEVETELFCCPVCTDIFGDPESLLRHIYFKHSEADSKNIPYETMKLIMECAKDYTPEKKPKKTFNKKYLYPF